MKKQYLTNQICCWKVTNIVEDNNLSNVTMGVSNKISEKAKVYYYYLFNDDMKNIKNMHNNLNIIEFDQNINRYINDNVFY